MTVPLDQQSMGFLLFILFLFSLGVWWPGTRCGMVSMICLALAVLSDLTCTIQ